MPTTIILVMPLCTGPEKQVWSLMRLRTSTPADSKAWRSIQTSPGRTTVPSFTTSIDARIGMPIAASVMPSDSIISRWPSAVPPLWEPIAGNRNGRAPCLRSQSPAALVMAAMLAMPRLPAVMPTSPCGTGKFSPSSAAWTAAGTSAIGFETSFWRTRTSFMHFSRRESRNSWLPWFIITAPRPLPHEDPSDGNSGCCCCRARHAAGAAGALDGGNGRARGQRAGGSRDVRAGADFDRQRRSGPQIARRAAGGDGRRPALGLVDRAGSRRRRLGRRSWCSWR